MSDSYQAIYDAVRSRIGGGDIGAAVEAAIAAQASGLSWAIESVKAEYLTAAQMQQAPHVLMRPALSPDGNQWCALYGANLHDGVAGFGDTPELAMRDFDKHWLTERRSSATDGVQTTDAPERVQLPEKARAGIEVLRDVVEKLLTTSRYVDEEGEATLALADMAACIADPPFKLNDASGVREGGNG